MKYPRILSALRSARWAIHPASLQAITDTLGAHLRGDLRLTAVHPRAATAAKRTDDCGDAPECDAEAESLLEKPELPGPAVIEVHGIIGKHLSSLESMCGGCDIEAVSEALDEAVADPSITAIILDFDSPGGTVTGVPELAAKIRRLDALKPIYAYTSGQCCSAAYWLASACRLIHCAPSADLGSIGVYIALVDDTEWWKKEGYKLELIKAGEYKAMGISGKPLTDAERGLLQSDVDLIYGLFTADIRRRRPDVADSTMQGQTFMGAQAQQLFLVDELIDDLPTFLARFAALG